MPNVLLLINEEAHIRELARVAELLLATSDLRPVAFMEERMKHLGVPKVFADLGIEVLSPDNSVPIEMVSSPSAFATTPCGACSRGWARSTRPISNTSTSIGG